MKKYLLILISFSIYSCTTGPNNIGAKKYLEAEGYSNVILSESSLINENSSSSTYDFTAKKGGKKVCGYVQYAYGALYSEKKYKTYQCK